MRPKALNGWGKILGKRIDASFLRPEGRDT